MNVLMPLELWALEPEEVLVVVNENVRESVSLGRYYVKKRLIPKSNLVKVSMSTAETCSRKEYDLDLAIPVREHLAENGLLNSVRCIALMYGIPLRIKDRDMSEHDRGQVQSMRAQLESLKEELAASGDRARQRILKRDSTRIERSMRNLMISLDRSASVDSDLALVLSVPYPVEGWVANPRYIRGSRDEPFSAQGSQETVLMVSRLDAPDAGIVRRIIDDSLLAERNTLRGRAYFDARWPKPDTAVGPDSAYRYYDQSIHTAAERVLTKTSMPMVVDYDEGLFNAADCPEAALYCGWYSLSAYMDAFEWVPGAVGYHIASGECVSLKDQQSRAWCPMMLKDGITATLGPVAEPYIQAFPLPDIFFSFLTSGRFTLVESYFMSLPYLSWKMVLIGDPLYRPFSVDLQGRYRISQ
ncbi:MAG TPA: TIGR03790 family protein [Deltaproteobacteria bacterium]|nr:TIGR03790 family protein [Deltaproteobacteria bacterium]